MAHHEVINTAKGYAAVVSSGAIGGVAGWWLGSFTHKIILTDLCIGLGTVVGIFCLADIFAKALKFRSRYP